MNIYEKMNAIMLEIRTVPKNLNVSTGKSSYKAVAEADILAAVKAAEAKHGVFSYPAQRRVVESRPIPTEREYQDRNKNTVSIDRKETQFIRLEVTYRFVNMEKPDEFVEVQGYGDGIDTMDKAPGKAATYADKYALMKAYKIETGDDNDRTASDELAGHDILKVKQRVELALTALVNRGMDEADILAGLGLSKGKFEALLGNFGKLAGFESAINRL